MRATRYFALALLAAAAIGGGPAFAATCKTDAMTCATGMPIDGYCECTAHGTTESGTVVANAPPRHMMKGAKAAGCGAHPNDPGCR